MKKDITDRIVYLAEMFDVFECGEQHLVASKLQSLVEIGFTPSTITSTNGTILAIISTKQNEKDRTLKKVSVCSDVYSDIIAADPTENKIYLQWMLTVFTQLIKDGKQTNIDAAIRFVEEDLPQSNKYLILFEDNKRKKKFKDLCLGSYSLKNVNDPTNINQYKSLSQLFDAVDPFIEKDPSAIERTLMKFVNAGKALMPVKDRKFTLYIPKTTEASTIFANFANWCTAREGNGMFKSYTEGHRKPNGKNSDIYIIINNDFFLGKSKDVFQIHFETNQLKDSRNGQNVSIFEDVISKSEGISNFFYEELLGMAKGFNKGLEDNKYIDYLIKFGFAESLFELIDYTTPTIKFMTREIPRLPDISKFKQLDSLIIIDAKMVDLHPSIGSLHNLAVLSLTNNRITKLPKEIGNLKNLRFLNITGNPITEIPASISQLDPSNGGLLFRVGVNKSDIGEENYKRLKELLPTTKIG